jgi:cation transport ATPase
MNERPNPDVSQESAAETSKWTITFVWAFITVALVISSSYITAMILDVVSYLNLGLMQYFVPFGIAISILHPGGWLSLIGLFFALKNRRYRWLFLSSVGAIITGIITTILILTGFGSISV